MFYEREFSVNMKLINGSNKYVGVTMFGNAYKHNYEEGYKFSS